MDRDKMSFVLDADLLTLRMFIAIVELGSFSAAANKVCRTQSAVSLQMAKLEDRMHVKLLKRSSRSVSLTEAGQIFISYAKRIIDIADEGLAAVSTIESSELLRVGFAEYLVPKHLPNLLGKFKRTFPNTRVELKMGMGFELYKSLNENKIDILIAGPEGQGGIELLREPLVWVGQKNRDKHMPETLDIVQMGAPCSYRKAAVDSLNNSGIRWSEAVAINNIQGLQSAVAAGFGVSTIPKSAVSNELEIIKSGLPALPETTINAFWNSTNPHPLTKRFISFIEEELREVGIY